MLQLPGVQAVKKASADGSERIYYRHRRSGMNLGTSADEASVIARYEALQKLAERAPGVRAAGTFGELSGAYQADPAWRQLAQTTRDTWRRALVRLESVWGPFPLGAISRAIAANAKVAFTKSHGPEGAKTMLAVARAIWSWAEQTGRTELQNPFLRLGSFTTREQRQAKKERKRAAIWREAEVIALLRATRKVNAGGNPAIMTGEARYKTEKTPDDIRMALLVGLFTCQRQTDILGVTAKQIVRRDDGLWWRLDQSKTGEFLGVKLHPLLVAEIKRQEIELGTARPLVRAPRTGEVFTRRVFARRWRLWTDAAGVRLTFQALRRSGMIWLAEIGVPLPQIAAISGHSIERTTAIIDEYIPRTERLARSAIDAWALDTRLSPAALLPEPPPPSRRGRQRAD
jgi:hypothetical protein